MLPANSGVPQGVAGWTDLLHPDPTLSAITSNLAVAERRGHHLAAARLSSRLAGILAGYGRYRAAAHWIEWGLHLHGRKNAPACMESLQVLVEWAAIQAMLGDVAAVEAAVDESGNNLPPQLRWLVDRARVHLLIVRQRIVEALALCESLWRQVGRRDFLLQLAPQYTQLLVQSGRLSEASVVAERAMAFGQDGDEDHARALLALGIALSQSNPARSSQALESARAGRLPVAARVQAVVHLAAAYDRTGRTDEARRILNDERSLLSEISPAGLAYLGGQQPDAVALDRPMELRFLGSREASVRGAIEPLRLRFAEIVTVLATHPEGMTAEQLTIAVYGESHDPACCKTELSRLRRAIPIRNRPYRLTLPVWADFLEITALLKADDLSAAIELYRGPLLPESEAPEVCDLRAVLDESLREAVLQRGKPEHLWSLVSRMREDLELWEAMWRRLQEGDPRRPLALAQIHSLRRAWDRDVVGRPRLAAASNDALRRRPRAV